MSLSSGLGGGLNRMGGGVQAAAWSPADLPGLAVTLLPSQSRLAGNLWQNAAKTVPATADGDPVRVAICPYTALEFTAPSDAARPLLFDEGGGKWSLSFDGVDDRMAYAGTIFATATWMVRSRSSAVGGIAGAFSCLEYYNNAALESTSSASIGSTTDQSSAAEYRTHGVTWTQGGSYRFRRNGADNGTGSAGGAVVIQNTTSVGGGLAHGFESGRFAGVLLYVPVYTGSDLSSIESHLDAL